jgi:hypothetical protein
VGISYELRFFIALAQTLAIETGLLLLMAKVWPFKTRFRAVRAPAILITGIIASLLTLPYVWFVFRSIIRERVTYLAVSEGFALLAEAFIYCFVLRIRFGLGLLLSLVCNAASFFSSYLVALVL